MEYLKSPTALAIYFGILTICILVFAYYTINSKPDEEETNNDSAEDNRS